MAKRKIKGAPKKKADSPKARSNLNYRRNAFDYRYSLQEGWVPFRGVKFRPWQKKAVERAREVLFGTTIGYMRRIEETRDSIARMTNIVSACFAQEMKGRLMDGEWMPFSRALRWFLKDPASFGIEDIPESIVNDAKKISRNSFAKIAREMESARKNFDNKGEEHSPGSRFSRSFEIQMNHDVGHAVNQIQYFFTRLSLLK